MSEEKDFKQTSSEKRVGPPYTAITLDTCIFVKKHFNFESGLLQAVKKTQIKPIISEIVFHEVSKQIREKHTEYNKKVDSLLSHNRRWHSFTQDEQEKIKSHISISEDFNPIQKWEEYSENYKIIESNNYERTRLTKSYFNFTPPFNESKNKSEFPDAIALLSLEAWAKENGAIILAISNDSGWLNFSEQSKYIDVISDLEIGLTQINDLMQEIEDWILGFTSQITSTDSLAVWSDINTFLTEKIEIHPAEVDENGTECSLEEVKGEVEELDYLENSLSFSNDKDELDISIIVYDPSITIFTVNAHIEISAQAEFNHLVEDPDGNEHNIGSSTKTTTAEKVSVRLLFELKGDINQRGYVPQITDISFIYKIIVPFGEIETMLMDDDGYAY